MTELFLSKPEEEFDYKLQTSGSVEVQDDGTVMYDPPEEGPEGGTQAQPEGGRDAVEKDHNADRKKARLRGIKLGIQVHKDLDEYVQCINVHKTPESFFQKTGRRPHPLAQKILDHIEAEKWNLISSEYRVYDEQIGVATSIDLVVMCRTYGSIIALEVKTGYDKGLFRKDAPGPPMKAPLEDQADNAFNRATLQSLLGQTIFCMGQAHGNGTKAPLLVPEQFYIIHAPTTGKVERMALAKWAYPLTDTEMAEKHPDLPKGSREYNFKTRERLSKIYSLCIDKEEERRNACFLRAKEKKAKAKAAKRRSGALPPLLK